MKRIVILDANVIVSALFGGRPREAVTRALKEDVFISAEIEAELDGLKKRLQKKLTFTALRYWVGTFLPSLMKKVNRIGIPPRLKICRDPKDDAYLSLAKAAHAEYLVTGDSDLLSLTRQDLERAGLSHLVITSPRGFLDLLNRG